MNRLFHLAVRLYPSWWRQRYGREFEALLEDVNPGWRELFDVVSGALVMQIKTLGTIPVVCALAGAIVGGVIAMRTPELFASTATLRLKASDIARADSKGAEDFRATLARALDASGGTKSATYVALLKQDSTQSIVKLTYLDREPARSQRAVEKMTAAVAAANSERAVSTEVLEPARLPTTPIGPDYPMNVASGSGIGLLIGAAVHLLVRFRRK